MPIVHPGAPESKVVSDDEIMHFDYPGSDIVLRSCDTHNFRVPKLYIINGSPVLRELILQSVSNTSDVPNGEQPEPLPVVELPESKATLYSLLTFIFPVVPILPSTTEKTMELLAVAQKYQMDSVLCHIRGAIAGQDPPFIRPETALHVYFLAQEHGLHREAVQAARVTLRLSMTIEDLGNKLEFPGMTGAHLHELWKYHQRVRNDLRSRVHELCDLVWQSLPDSDPDDAFTKGSCRDPYSYAHDNLLPQWLGGYIESIAEAPQLLDPIEFENAWALHIKTMGSYIRCPCAEISSQTIRVSWDALTAAVDRTIKNAISTLALVKEETTSESLDPPSVPLRLKNIPDADIILRSSDQVNLRVRKSLLAISSPFFEDLLSLPQPPDGELVDGLPVVQLSEDAGLLISLISLLYPIPPVIPGSYEKVFALLAACQKYDMVSLQSNIRDAVKLGTFPAASVGAEAFGAYAIASSMGLVPEMENAAHLTLNYPMTFESLGEGLRLFKGRALCDLVSYRNPPRPTLSPPPPVDEYQYSLAL